MFARQPDDVDHGGRLAPAPAEQVPVPGPEGLLVLQRSAGNAAVSRLVTTRLIQRRLYTSHRNRGRRRRREFLLSNFRYYTELQREHPAAIAALERGPNRFVANRAELERLIADYERAHGEPVAESEAEPEAPRQGHKRIREEPEAVADADADEPEEEAERDDSEGRERSEEAEEGPEIPSGLAMDGAVRPVEGEEISLEEIFGIGHLENWDRIPFHRHLMRSGELRHRFRNAKITQNRVRAGLGVALRGAKRQRIATVEIPVTFGSGEQGFRGAAHRRLVEWLVQIGVIADATEYLSTRHAHSEQELAMWLREPKNLTWLLDRIAELVEEGEDVVGALLDLVSYPNTVCTPCHDSVDAVLSEVVMPAVRARFGVRDEVPVAVNASAPLPFGGGGRQESDEATWREMLVNFDALAAEEQRSRHDEGREARRSGRGRGSKEEEQEPKKGGHRKSPRGLAQEDRQELAGQFHRTFVHIDGIGNACYIRAIVTGIARTTGLLTDVEAWVDTVTDHLEALDVRMDGETVDAGGLAAALIRDTIQQLTTDVIDGGIDVAINVAQLAGGVPTVFQANAGRLQLTLLYTPGHFDLLL